MDNSPLISLFRTDPTPFPGQTLPACLDAWEKGVLPEAQIHATSDLVALLSLTNDLPPSKSMFEKIEKTPFEKIQKLVIHSSHGLDHLFPTLEEVLEEMRKDSQRRFLFHLTDSRVFLQVLEEIKQRNLARQCYFSIHELRWGQIIKKTLPDATIHYRFKKLTKHLRNAIHHKWIDTIVYVPYKNTLDDILTYPIESGFSHWGEIARMYKKSLGVVLLETRISRREYELLLKSGVRYFSISNLLDLPLKKTYFDK